MRFIIEEPLLYCESVFNICSQIQRLRHQLKLHPKRLPQMPMRSPRMKLLLAKNRPQR
jgi:hypothetical protein